MVYDIVIAGAGPSGLTAAMYAARAEMSTLVISDMIPGGNAMLTEEISNYPGFPESVKGPDLIGKMHEQVKALKIEFKTVNIKGIKRKDKNILIETSAGTFETIALILAMGTTYKKLGVKGEEEFVGKGISYCGVCDAPIFRNKEIAVVGGGDTAVYEAGHLLKFASKLHLIHRRDRLRAAKILQDKVLSDKKAVIHLDSVVEEIYGAKLVEAVSYTHLTLPTKRIV